MDHDHALGYLNDVSRCWFCDEKFKLPRKCCSRDRGSAVRVFILLVAGMWLLAVLETGVQLSMKCSSEGWGSDILGRLDTCPRFLIHILHRDAGVSSMFFGLRECYNDTLPSCW